MNTIIKNFVYVIIVSSALFIIFMMGVYSWGDWYDEWSGYNASQYVSDGVCNIAVVPIHGSILGYENEYGSYEGDPVSTSPEDVQAALQLIESDSYIHGILLKIDSPGGSPAGAFSIADMITSQKLPTVAYIGDYGTSAGYLIASAARSIIASPFSDIGSIGVTMSYLDNSKQNEYDGLEFVELSSAPYKDYLNPNRPLSDDEYALIERDLAIYHQAFIDIVVQNRSIDTSNVAALADGSSMPATLALTHKLIDQIGNTLTVREALARELSIPVEEVILCE